ncbi:hypothetical protein [Saccharothrix xinjiangensis]|uniref:hypothetical protein n=1 Tax=Saccharothrix xinjiangensis TaxID=204798 RepID=UPI0031D21AF0
MPVPALAPAEGGAVAAPGRFGCGTDDNRAPVTATTWRYREADRYEGARVVRGGVATEVSRAALDVAPGGPVFDLDGESCE